MQKKKIEMHSLYHKILYTNNVSREQLFMSVPDLRYSTQQIDVLGKVMQRIMRLVFVILVDSEVTQLNQALSISMSS